MDAGWRELASEYLDKPLPYNKPYHLVSFNRKKGSFIANTDKILLIQYGE